MAEDAGALPRPARARNAWKRRVTIADRPGNQGRPGASPRRTMDACRLPEISSAARRSCERPAADMLRPTCPDLVPTPPTTLCCAASPTPWSASRPRRRAAPTSTAADAFVWHAGGAAPVAGAAGQPGRDRRCCAASTGSATRLPTTPSASPAGLPANNALLWGARGMGKSSLVKAVHAEINRTPRRRRAAAQADRDPPRGHRDPAGADEPPPRRTRTASSCSATTSPSTPTTPPTSR